MSPNTRRSRSASGGLKGTRERLGLTKRCNPGQILRAPYKRKFSSQTKRTGYNVRKGGRTIRVYPKSGSTLVQAACIENRGLPGKGSRSGKAIGPLKEGELKRYGYNVHLSSEKRHAALRKAVAAYGALNVFRKLTAVANLTVRTAPEAYKVFVTDRAWIQNNFVLKKRN